jgi:hypothetical protein
VILRDAIIDRVEREIGCEPLSEALITGRPLTIARSDHGAHADAPVGSVWVVERR